MLHRVPPGLVQGARILCAQVRGHLRSPVAHTRAGRGRHEGVEEFLALLTSHSLGISTGTQTTLQLGSSEGFIFMGKVKSFLYSHLGSVKQGFQYNVK